MPTGVIAQHPLLGTYTRDSHHDNVTVRPEAGWSIRSWLVSKALWRSLVALMLASTFLTLLYRLSKTASFEGASGRSSCSAGEMCLDDIDWTGYAYAQYVTNDAYLCNSLMIFQMLRELGARVELLLMYPESYEIEDNSSSGRLLTKAQALGVHLAPITVQHLVGESTWAESFTKLLASSQTQYRRVLHIDSDAMVLQVSLAKRPIAAQL
jgi:hypothetical protein